MQTNDYEVLKVFNNNVVLTSHSGMEKILIKKGLGFGKKEGDKIDSGTSFDKVFALENGELSSKFNQLVTKVDDNIVGICEEIIVMISSEMGEPLDEGIHIRLTDHIAFAVHRIKNNDIIANPFIVEIETLYPKEVAIARNAVFMLEKSLKIQVPEDEVGFVALHIHSARNRGKLSNSIKYAYLSNTLVELIEDETGIIIERRSIDYARFISHIRFALERIIKNIPIKNELLSSIKRTYKDSYAIAKKAARLIEEELDIKVSDNEKGYLAMHIERLKNNAGFI